MKADVQNAIKALVGGKAQASDLSVLMSNGLTLPAITGCAAQFAKLANGQMLSQAEIADLTAKGANVEQFLGLKPKATVPAAATPAPVNPENVAVVPVGPKVNIVPNVTIQQTAQVEGDPFAFILKVEAVESEQGKALRSLYNSMVSRQQTKVVEGYRKALADVGVKIETKQVSEAMKVTRTEIGLDKMLDGVLSKKGFKTSRDEQNRNLIAAFRDNLTLLGIEITDEQHAKALEFGKAFGDQFAEAAAAGLRKRGLAFA